MGNQLTVNPETFWLARPLTLKTAYTCPPTATFNLKEADSPANSSFYYYRDVTSGKKGIDSQAA